MTRLSLELVYICVSLCAVFIILNLMNFQGPDTQKWNKPKSAWIVCVLLAFLFMLTGSNFAPVPKTVEQREVESHFMLNSSQCNGVREKRVAIIQAGLLSTWIWESTIENVVKPNPKVHFDFYIALQERPTASRFRPNDTTYWEKTADEPRVFQEAISVLPNARISYLKVFDGVNQNVALAEHVFYSVRSRYRSENTFLKASELILLKEATMQVDMRVDYVYAIKLREDAAWYKNLKVEGYFRHNAIYFLHCDHGWGGVSNKAWMGKMETIFKYNLEMFAGMFQLEEPVKNMETLCAMVLKKMNFNYVFNSRTIYLSDGRRRLDGKMCFQKFYHCFKRSKKYPVCSNLIRSSRVAATGSSRGRATRHAAEQAARDRGWSVSDRGRLAREAARGGLAHLRARWLGPRARQDSGRIKRAR
ncbi:hypothetical protein RI054_16g77230 [Pseudoscourfieldia marina]